MPASVTHAYFASDVYDTLPANIKNCLSVSRLRMFAQSTDSFLFYRLFSLKPSHGLRKFQHTFHVSKSQDFFINLIQYIKDAHLEKDIDTCSFLCGFISHYVLDSTMHPFIFYKTGKFRKNDPETYKYNSLHTLMEVYLDNHLILAREKHSPYTFPVSNFCFDLTPFSEELNSAISYVFNKVFQLPHMDVKYFESLKNMKFALATFRQDRFGIKKAGYKLIDTFTPKKWIRLEFVSYHVSMKTSFDFLNFNHRVWRNPTTYSITSKESFYDLYVKALKLSKKIIEDTFLYLKGENIDLKAVYTNLSYVTGLDCNLKKKLKYFEF